MKNWIAPGAATAAIVGAATPMYLTSPLSFLDTWLSLWLICYVVGFLLIALEGAFFFRSPEIHRLSQFVAAFLATGVIAAIAGLLFRSGSMEFTLVDRCRDLLGARSAMEWAVRLIGVAGLYTFAYAVIGSATWPFVRTYYEDPQNGLALRIPTGRVIILLQTTRGLITTLALVPLIATIPAIDATWWLMLSLLLVAVMAIGPLAMATRWPIRLRLAHAIEITVFVVVYSCPVWWFIARPAASW